MDGKIKPWSIVWLCRELFACIGYGTLLFTVAVVFPLAVITGDGPLLISASALIVGVGLIAVVVWCYGWVTAGHTERPISERAGWSKVTKVLMRSLIGFPVAMVLMLLGLGAVESVAEITSDIRSNLSWVFVTAVIVAPLYVITSLLLSFTNKKAARFVNIVGIIVTVILLIIALMFPLCAEVVF